ncbi:MAG: enolase C-terminal domain-like protein [Actinomycetales bacterium]
MSGTQGRASVTDATIDDLSVEVYTVPTDSPEADGTMTWDKTTMVLVRARSGDTEGIGYTYASPACRPLIEGALRDQVLHRSALDTTGAWVAVQRQLRNIGRPGIGSCALSAIDIALHDLKGRLLGVPVADLLGRCFEDVKVYGSGGFTTYDDERTVEQMRHWAKEQAIPRVKLKIGESWGSREQRDLHRVELVRSVVGDEVEVFVDANGGYTVGQAVRMGRRYDALGVIWFEEPVSSDDLAGLHEIRGQITADVAAGEYGYDLVYFDRMIDARAVDCLQVDVTRCGGYTEWFRIAAVAAGSGLQVSAHCAPNLAAHPGVATPNVRHLEWFHDHVRIEELFFEGTLDPQGGTVTPSRERPGLGLTLRTDEAARYAVRE